MTLTRNETKELLRLKKIAKGTPLKITMVGGSNVRLSGIGKSINKQLGGNVGLSAVTIAKAKVKSYLSRL